MTDPHRKKEAKTSSGHKPGGQHGHIGKTLKHVADPDIIKPIPVDRSLLPPGEYRKIGHELRQVIDQLQMPISAGSIVNFNQDAYSRLEYFDTWVKEQLFCSSLVHVDETGVNIGGVRNWLHNTSNDRFSYFYPHQAT